MSQRTVVVDGSNIATEGRQMPSLKQLDEAVRAYREEHPDDEIIVVVDATFAHRIADDERPLFEDAAAHNELVYPPAGAIGRGDAFLLRIAEKTSAVVLSNDSFQEFHGEHDWLFDKGRLVGGTPVPGVGWIFVPRTPVRGPKSREAVKEAKRSKARVGSKEALQPMPVPKVPPPRRKKGKKGAADGEVDELVSGDVVGTAIAVATEEAVGGENGSANGKEGKGGRKRRRKRRGGAGAAAEPELPTLNEPLTFIEFIADHKLGSTVTGVVESFASHGAFVLVGEARCYIPLSAMGDPPPRSAREVLRKGEDSQFVVQALDAARRGIELALPGHEHLSGAPTAETVEAEIEEAPRPGRKGRGRGGRKAGAAVAATPVPVAGASEPPATKKAAAKRTAKKAAPAPKAAATTKTTKKAATKKKAAAAAAKKTAAPAARKAAPAAKKATAAPKKAAASKKAAPAKKAATKATVAKKAAPAKAASKTAAKTATAKAPAPKKSAVKKAPAAKKPAAKKATSTKKAPAAAKKPAAAAKKTRRT
ncbi:MAG TPA: S1 RNA-binding domain-containing protein [Acidimicrobiales bacterium]